MTNTNFKRIKRNIIALAVAMATIIGSVAPATQTVQAAVYQSSIIYDGEGELTKTLTTGQKAAISVSDSIINITVDGEKYGYYNTKCVGTCTIAADDLLHIFWHTGHYYVYDLRESGMFIKAYKDSSQKYCSEDTNGATEVLGTSTPNVNLHSSIIDGTYFYQYGKTGKKALMTRSEFTNIVDPQPEEPNQPTEPENPDKPDKPTEPTQPTEPENPDKPTIDITININKPILGSGNTTNALTKYPDRTVNTKPNKRGWIKVKFYQGGVSPKQYTSYTKFNKKKGIMTFNKLRFTKIVDCGYISETRNVYFLKRKKGKICELYTLPRNAKRRTQMRKIPGKYVSVQKNTWGMATKATKSNGNIIDLVAKDKKFNKK
ncbi:MAG: hypothetical protein HFJ35_01700 [Clostridia bacterium]|nr:hypothetical protein [Clostridia bacterium]